MQERLHALLIWLVIWIGFTSLVQAQMPVQGSAIRVGLGLTGYAYRGDLTADDPSFWRINPGANVSLQFRPYKRIQPQLNAGFGSVVEQLDRNSIGTQPPTSINSFFETNFFYMDFRLAYVLFRKSRIQPYLVGGGGLFFFNPLDQNGNFLIDNIFTREDGELYNTTAFVLPVGTGLRIHVNQLAYIGLEYMVRTNVTDYVDNIGLRGEVAGNDQLHNFQVSLNFTLRGKPEEESTTPPDPIDTPPVLVAKDEPQPAIDVPDKLPAVDVPDADTELKRKKRTLATLEWADIQPPSEPVIFPIGDQAHLKMQPIKLSPAEQAYYQQMVKLALDNNWTLDVSLEKPVSWTDLSHQYHISLVELKKLNSEITAPLKSGTNIRIPDIAQAISYDAEEKLKSRK